jgi:RNA polymerase sigma-70 factor, ECF subfamily
MLGSWTDAEDVLQDALLRAWRGLSGFQGQASFRSWLYQVATNACLSALRTRRARSMPQLEGAPTPPDQPAGPMVEVERWVEPYLDAAGVADLASAIEARQSVTLGFIIALQHLPARQRAVLMLCEVVGYEASEVAEILGMSTTAVESAIARARANLARARREAGVLPQSELREDDRKMLSRYKEAWESGDVNALVSLLSREATFSMPPVATWFRGKAGVRSVLTGHVFAEGGRFRFMPTTASGMPAFVVYKAWGPGQEFRALGVQVVWVRRGRVRAVTTFINPRLAEMFATHAKQRARLRTAE